MAKVGCLGDIAFEVSDSTIETINNVSWSGSARYSTHERHLGNALTEFTGLDPDAISFDIYLSAYLGASVMQELVKIWTAERNGTALPLTIGGKAYGKYRWTITSHKIAFEQYDREGNLAAATVSIELMEYLLE